MASCLRLLFNLISAIRLCVINDGVVPDLISLSCTLPMRDHCTAHRVTTVLCPLLTISVEYCNALDYTSGHLVVTVRIRVA